ncbi:MAG: DNA adenine methylase, partial [bacterium]
KSNALSNRSPLRYPGGKTRAVEIITSYFPKNLKTFLSPFLGGGSIELQVSSQGTYVFGFDIFEPLVEFWQCLTQCPDKLAERVSSFYPLSKEDFYKLQRTQTESEDKITRAAVYYVLNRSSFSGATLSGGMSPDHPRFTKSSIERIKSFRNTNIQVDVANFTESLTKYESIFAYIDPPYLIKSSLYGKKGNAHKQFDHYGLSNILKNRNEWILSYNDCEEIHELYKGYKIVKPSWKYGMSNNKFSKEILIFSKDQ